MVGKRGLAGDLAEWIAGLEWEHAPPELRDTIKLHALDTLGVTLAAIDLPSSRAIREVVLRQGGVEEATMLGDDAQVPAASAALAHASFAHSLDFDDTFPASVLHPGCLVVPAALATAEATGASGGRLLAAMLAGYELAARVSAPAGRALHARGFQSTGVFGPLVAAAVAGRVYGLDAQALARAMGVAGSMGGGLLEFLRDGSWSKRLHPGWAAHGGVVAAELARAGFTGPDTVLEGGHGLYRAFLHDHDVELGAILDGLGSRWEAGAARVKLYPCAHVIHPFLDAALALRAEHDLRPAEIASVECSVAGWQVPIVWEPRAEKVAPAGEYQARGSQPFAIAAALVDGRVDLDTFTDDAVRRPELHELAARVRHLEDPRWEKGFGGGLAVETPNGPVESVAASVEDDAELEPRVLAKLRSTAGRVLTRRSVEDLETTVRALEESSAADVVRICARGRRPPS